tara:strand:+ start:5152 stop:6864 length:1713 start_codon:yes stop_codon:yes gene_type:complete
VAHFLPALNLDTEVPGEIEFFLRLKNDPTTKNWWVLHSYFLSKHINQSQGEIDFVVFIPNRGVVVVEVKSHKKIQVKNGDFYYGFRNKLGKNPFKQSYDNMWSLIEIIREHQDKPRNFSKMIWTHAVVTPTARFSYESPEYQGWKLCDSNELNKKSLSTFLLNAIEEQLKKDLPNRNYIDNNACNPTNIVKCLEILKPEGESILETPDEREMRILKEINEFTPEQNLVLQASQFNNQLHITGPAGTGKTTLAIQIASEKSVENERVLYMCYNENLKSYINSQYGDSGFDIKTFHGLLNEIADIEIPTNADEYFFNETLLNEAYNNLSQKDIYYDHLIIDEFQDLANESTLIFLDRLLSGGLKGGKWKLFADYKNQNLYRESIKPENVLDDYLGLPSFKLELGVNCRNTPSIVDFIQDHIEIDPYRDVRRFNGDLEPTRKLYKDNKEQANNLKNTLNNLQKVYDKNEILVLSPITNGVVEIYNQEYSGSRINKLNFRSEVNKQEGPFFSTIKSFKGLEFHTIVIVDIDIDNFLDIRDMNRQLYTAISRGLETVSLHITKDALKLLQENNVN